MEAKVKKWYASKTFWVNTLALVATVIQGFTGFVISPELQGILLTLVNIILRWVTNEQIVW